MNADISLESVRWEGPVPIVHTKHACSTPINMAGYKSVYKMILIDVDSKPIPIMRKHKIDYDGILRIGRTTNLKQRFVKTRRDYRVAMEYGDQVEFREDVEIKYPGFGYAFEYIRLKDNESDIEAEKLLHAEYLMEFGEEAETPVTGSVLHDKNHKWRVWLRSE